MLEGGSLPHCNIPTTPSTPDASDMTQTMAIPACTLDVVVQLLPQQLGIHIGNGTPQRRHCQRSSTRAGGRGGIGGAAKNHGLTDGRIVGEHSHTDGTGLL